MNLVKRRLPAECIGLAWLTNASGGGHPVPNEVGDLSEMIGEAESPSAPGGVVAPSADTDGVVNFGDVTDVLTNWGNGC